MLDDLILPNTPEAVRVAYQKLAQRARIEDFDLLEDDVVVLDTETTGLSFSDCQLIEIAAARLHGRTIADRFHTFVNPGSPIPSAITELTGITDDDVREAPTPVEAVANLADFVCGAPVLAHNATFDRTFIERVPGGGAVSDIWIDTLALSRIALPRLSTHRLQDMAEAFGCANVTHRAMDDVEALAGMWRIILCALTDFPGGLLRQLADMHPEVEWAYRPIFARLAAIAPTTAFSILGERMALVSAQEVKQREDADKKNAALEAPMQGDILSAFEDGGVISKMYPAFENRPQQLEMSQEVRRSLASSSMCAIEAGTGVGKSIAYLLPLALYAKKNKVTCGVSTKSNALTDQLVSHELPALSKVLPEGVSYTCLKGYDHYPCLRKLVSATNAHDLPLELVNLRGRSQNTAASDMLSAIAVTYTYACQSLEGDIDSLGIRWASVPRQMLTTTSNECQRSRCPYYPTLCMLHGSRRRASSCDIVVTNHSLLLCDIKANNQILPPVRNWVVDEAHSFEDEARRQWALELSAINLAGLFEAIGGNKSGLLGAISIRAAKSENPMPIVGLVAKAQSASSRAQIASGDFFDAVRTLAALDTSRSGYDLVTIWLSDEVRNTSRWEAVREAGEVLVERLEAFKNTLASLDECTRFDIENMPGDLSDMVVRVEEAWIAAKTIVSGTDTSYVYSVEVSHSKKNIGHERLVAQKLDIGSELASRWYPNMHSVAFCSATMTVDNTFEHFNQAMGLNLLDRSLHRERALESCFDFDNHMAAIVASDMPDPRDSNYLDALENLLYDVHVAMGGSVLTLFTNRREMTRVYEALQPRLAEVGLDVIVQDKDTSNKRLSKQFIEEENLSLMALKSFWEGFDAAGNTLRCVVIPKLPFANPSDPISQERAKDDSHAWWTWNLPEAVLSVKQASGRLIRTSTDTGILVLCDSRLTTKRYGKTFMRSLPTRTVSTLECDEIGSHIRAWRNTH